MSKLLDAYALTDMAESQGHDEVQEALLTQQQFHDGTLFTEEDLTLHFSPGRKTLILGEQSSPEMISDSDAEDTILTKNMFTFRVCHLENVPFLVVSCFFHLEKVHDFDVQSSQDSQKDETPQPDETKPRDCEEPPMEAAQEPETKPGNTGTNDPADKERFFTWMQHFLGQPCIIFLFSGMKPNEECQNDIHPGDPMYVQKHAIE